MQTAHAAMATTTNATSIGRYRRAANYLAAAQIYLKDNVLLDEPLRPTHIKDRLLGHWGTCPGINLVYTHLNRLIRERDANVLLITGPGHGAAANLANLYLEGTLSEFYPELTRDRDGLERFVRAFSWPGGFPSHLSPPVPGTIHEGGELGYALATAFGAALDNPDLIVACIVGDGEAETGPTATAWHSTKFLDPATSGAVLPILHLNGFKISSPTIFATMSDKELTNLFAGYGYAPHIVDVDTVEDPDTVMAEAVDRAYEAIRAIQRAARAGSVGPWSWPVLLLRSPKGWTGPEEIDGVPIEGTFRAHQVPAKDARTNPAHLAVLETWLRSYRPEELFDADGCPEPDILATCPTGIHRIGMNPHTRGWQLRRELDLPPLADFALPVSGPGETTASALERAGTYLAEVLRRSEIERNFRIVCPDEITSNLLGAVFTATGRTYAWPVEEAAAEDARLSPTGRVMEILSEHTCQGWLQGYLQTGRHGLFPCYEAFVTIVDSMANQYGKWLKMSAETPWREPVPSLTYLLTSDTWRQDHNGYSHQGPGFINSLLTKKGSIVRIYLPPDANSLVSTLDHCLRSTDTSTSSSPPSSRCRSGSPWTRRSLTMTPERPSGRGPGKVIQSGRISCWRPQATYRRLRRSRRRRSCARSCPSSRCGSSTSSTCSSSIASPGIPMAWMTTSSSASLPPTAQSSSISTAIRPPSTSSSTSAPTHSASMSAATSRKAPPRRRSICWCAIRPAATTW